MSAANDVGFAPPGLEWATKLRKRWIQGEKLPQASIDVASEALGEVWVSPAQAISKRPKSVERLGGGR